MSKSDRLLGLIDAANEYGWLVTMRQYDLSDIWIVVLDDDGNGSYCQSVSRSGDSPTEALRNALNAAGDMKATDDGRDGDGE